MTPSVPGHTQVLVIGGGPAGAGVATVLAEAGIPTLLLERRTFPRPRIGESLTPKVTPLLSILGVRERVEGAGFVRMAGTTVDHGAGRETHLFDPEGRRLGYQADRAVFDQILLQRAKAAGAEVHEEVKVIGVLRSGTRVVGVEWASPNGSGQVEAEWVVDASGGAAVLSRALGQRRRALQRTVALAGYFRGGRRPTEHPPGNTLFEMIDEGWIWSVLHADGRRNVTLGLDAARVRARSASYLELYHRLLERSRLVAPLLVGATLSGGLSAHDATWARSEAYAGDGWLLSGDAASVIDPLTSQGVYKALQSAIVGAAVVQTVLKRPADRGLALHYYQESQARFAANYAAIALSFYRRSPHQEQPFWRIRTQSSFADHADVAPADLQVLAERRRHFTERVTQAGGDRVMLRVRPGIRVEPRPVAERGFIELRPGWVSDGAPIDSAGVDPGALLQALGGGTVAQAFEAYIAQTGQERSSALARALMIALGNLAERNLLELAE
ncbi:MAG: tryptophan 7-halogenase [Deltaproteobacteria bacterium]|nr:tryptophan 7-halogenase [Deltaproteobacteria bacterium]